jgi:hypothetical protein
MSKQNKANKTNYVQAGRLTPDDMARERGKMRVVHGGGSQAAPKTTGAATRPVRGRATAGGTTAAAGRGRRQNRDASEE